MKEIGTGCKTITEQEMQSTLSYRMFFSILNVMNRQGGYSVALFKIEASLDQGYPGKPARLKVRPGPRPERHPASLPSGTLEPGAVVALATSSTSVHS
jgi:hypothetical protein